MDLLWADLKCNVLPPHIQALGSFDTCHATPTQLQHNLETLVFPRQLLSGAFPHSLEQS